MKRFGKRIFTAILLAVAALGLLLFASCGTENNGSGSTGNGDNGSASKPRTQVTVDFNGGELNDETSVTFKMDADAQLSAQLAAYDGVARDGYAFAGWDAPEKTDGSYGETVSVTAKWTAVTYTISYDLAGGQNEADAPTTYTIESSEVTLPDAPSRSGYTFSGWMNSDGETVEAIPSGSFGNVSLKAVWKAEKYEITYDYAEGQLPEGKTNPATYTVEDFVSFTYPVREGYTFKGFITDEDADTLITTLDEGTMGDLSLTAVWSPNALQLTIELDGGKYRPGESNPASFDIETAEIVLKEPVKEGYTFKGFYNAENEKVTSIPTGTAHDVALTAQWELVEYDITYSFGSEGELPEGAKTTYTVEDSFNLPTPTREGYSFTGWRDANGDPAYYIPKGSTGSVEFTGSWSPIIAVVTCYLPESSEASFLSVYRYGEKISFDAEINNPDSDVRKMLTSYGLELSGFLNEDGSVFDEVTVESLSFYDVYLDVYTSGMEFELLSSATQTFETETSIDFSQSFYVASISPNKMHSDWTSLYYPQYYNNTPVEVIEDVNQINEDSYFANITSAYIPANIKLVWVENSNVNYNGLFNGASNLEKVTFAAGSKLQELNDPGMFRDTASLKTITFPDTVEYIADRFFTKDNSGAVGLTSFTVPKALKKLPQDTFGGAIELESFVIPEGSQLTEIGSFGGEYPNVTSLDFTNATKLVTLPSLSPFYNVATFKFPASLEEIGTFAGSTNKNTVATEIDLSNTKIENLAANTFQHMTELASVKFPATLTTIGQRLFGANNSGSVINANTHITELDFSGTQLETVPELAFAYMTALKTVKLPSSLKSFGKLTDESSLSVTNASNISVFESSTNVTSVDFGGAVLDLLGDYAFYGLSQLGELNVTIAANGKMGSHVFADAGSTISVTLGEGATYANSAFFFTKATTLNLNGFKTFGETTTDTTDALDKLSAITTSEGQRAKLAQYPVLYGSTVQTVKFDSALTELKDFAFALSGATPVFENTNVKYGKYLFYKSTITSFDFTGTPFKDVTEKMFYGSASLATLKGFDVLETVETEAFVGTAVRSFEIGLKITKIDPTAFESGQVDYTVTTGQRYYSMSTDPETGDKLYILYKPEGNNSRVSVFYDVELAENKEFSRDFTGESGTITELSNAYAGSKLTSIKLPATVTTIPEGAFENCAVLTDAEFSGTLQSIGANAFKGCVKFSSFIIPSSVESIGAGAFMNSGLTTLSAQAGSQLTTVGDNAFSGSKLTSVDLKNASKLKTLGKGSFANLTVLPEGQEFTVTFPATADPAFTELPANLFQGSTVLTKIEIPAYITKFSAGVFTGTKLTSLSFAPGSQLEELSGSALTGLAITELSLPDGLTKIGKAAFAGMTALQKVVIPANATIEAGTSTSGATRGAFAGCTALAEVEFKGTGVTVPTYTFYGCTKLVTVNFENVKTIGQAAFYNTGFTELTLGEIEIGMAAFASSTQLKTVSISAKATLTPGTSNSTTSNGVFGSCAKLDSVTITGEGTDKIALSDYAFYGATLLKSFDFSKVSSVGTACFTTSGLAGEYDLSALTSIGKAAFASTKITIITLSSATEMIDGTKNSGADYGPFGGCTTLTTVNITKSGDSLLSVPAYGFYGCTKLSSFDFVNVGKVGKDAFHMGSFGSATALLSEKSDFSNITEIGDNAFYFYNVATVNLTKATKIGGSAFYGAENLTSVTLAENVEIGKAAFADSGLTSVTLPKGASLTAGSNTTGANLGAFGLCEKLAAVTFADNVSAFEVPNYTFYGCPVLKNVEFAKISSIGNYAFSKCGFESVALAKDATLGTNAFEGCASLATVILTEDATSLAVSNSAFKSCAELATFPFDKVSSIGSSSFEGCTSLTEVTFSQNVALGGSAFKNCTGLTKVDFEHVTAIGSNGFEGCAALTEAVAKPSAVGKNDIADSAFKSCTSLVTITLPADIKTIGSNAFQDCFRLVIVVNLSNSLTNVTQENCGKNPSGNNYVTQYAKLVVKNAAESTGLVYKTTDGKFMALKETPEGGAVSYTAIVYYGTESEVTFPEKLVLEGDIKVDEYALGDYLFYKNTAITGVSIPASVTKIGAYAFQNTSKLKTVTIDTNNSKLTSIGIAAFNTSALTSIKIPAGCELASGTTESEGVFAKSASLTKVELMGTGYEIPGYAFSSCSTLKELDFTKIKSIGSAAFYKTAFTSIELPAEVKVTEGTTTSSAAFGGNTALTTVKFNSTEAIVPAYAFYGCTNLSTVNFENVITIGKAAFYNTGFATLKLKSETSVYTDSSSSNAAFGGCKKLTTFEFIGAGTWTEIPQNMFYGAPLTKFNASDAENVVLPAGLTEIGAYAFYGTQIVSVEIPASVTSIGAYAFNSCKSLTSVTFEAPNGEAKDLAIGESAFNATGITEITLPARVNSIGTSVFQNCASLLTADLTAANITKLTTTMFRGCTVLKTVKLPTALAADGLDAKQLFLDCTALTDIWYDGEAILAEPTQSGTSGSRTSARSNTVFAACGNVTIHVKDASKYEGVDWAKQFTTQKSGTSLSGSKATFVNIEAE